MDEPSVMLPTRREILKGGGALVGGGLLAGCIGGSGPSDGADNSNNSGGGANSSDGSSGTGSATSRDRSTMSGGGRNSYSVTMAPMAEVKFNKPPTRVIGEWGFVADILTALGHADAMVGMARPSFWFTGFYNNLPGVSVSGISDILTTVTKSYRVNRELLHELNPDLIAADPNKYISSYRMSTNEVARLKKNIAPFFGNQSSEKRPPNWPNWPVGHGYRYYSIPEFVNIYGKVFREQERAKAITDLYSRTMREIISQVPPRDKRPSIGLLSAFTNPESRGFFGVYNPIPELPMTYEMKQYGDLNVIDAFANKYTSKSSRFGLKTDFEGLLEVDPDVLIFDEAVTTLTGGENIYGTGSAYKQTVEILRTDPLGQQLTAVKNEQLFPGGTSYQGPIINLFQTEMLAKQLYPEQFGSWPGFDKTIPKNERLFDRQRVADIIKGNF